MFCRNCGKNIPDDSKFCISCGTPVENNTISNQATFKLTIDRASQVYLINPPIKVTIDNSIRFSVENGQTHSIDISSGNHKIYFKSSLRSATLEVDIQKDTLIEVKWSRISGAIIPEVK